MVIIAKKKTSIRYKIFEGRKITKNSEVIFRVWSYWFFYFFLYLFLDFLNFLVNINSITKIFLNT
jgi:hypothetical protein